MTTLRQSSVSRDREYVAYGTDSPSIIGVVSPILANKQTDAKLNTLSWQPDFAATCPKATRVQNVATGSAARMLKATIL